MDFSYLLDLAKKNEEYAKEAVQVKRYSTQVSAPKKEQRSGVQSDSIRKFLERKEQEEQQKQKDEKQKREKLLALRAQDRKSNARVQAMLKRTKAANKAVLDEAKNCQNTAVTAAGLDVQPDEDDYGYVSQEASQFYKKLMDKYNSGPSTDSHHSQKVRSQKELDNAKDRVKEALHKIEENETTIHRKRRKKDLVESIEQLDKKTAGSKDKDKDQSKKSRPKGPPASTAGLSFDEILKLAATKQHEPIKVEKKAEVVKKSTEPERLMTKKEKEEREKELLRQRERQLRKEGKLPPLSATPASVAPVKGKDKDKTTASASKQTGGKEPAKATTSSNSKTIPKAASSQNGHAAKAVQRNPSIRGDRDVNSAGMPASKTQVTKQAPLPARNNQQPAKNVTSKPLLGNHPSTASGPQRPSAVMGSKQVPPTKGKMLAPPGDRPFPPYRDAYPPMRRPPVKHAYESDEEEVDSELDDFIDDGPVEGANEYSKYIQEIFGSRYRRIESDDDDGDDCMESSYAQMMREEIISAKIGKMEDDEEERREEEEKRMKMLAKKGKKRK